MRRFEYTLMADYFQFYLQDEQSSGDLSDHWTHEALQRLLAVGPGVIGVGTVRNMEVPVVVEVIEAEPEVDAEAWDHVVECELDVPSGRVVIVGCTDYFPGAARFDVKPGSYRARISYGSLNELSDDGLDGDDRYRVQLWLAESIVPRVLKQRSA